jgi:hypothetical protein
VERARYEVDQARNRYMQVDPNNRLVADTLEADWNDRLRALSEAQEDYEQQRQKDRVVVDEASREKVFALAQDLPRLWRDPGTSDRDRKRMVRMLIEDVTLTRSREIRVQIRFKGGATRTLTMPIPLNAGQQRKTSDKVVAELDRLLDSHTDARAAAELNRLGYRSGMNQMFTGTLVSRIRRGYDLKDLRTRLLEAGMLTLGEMARRLGVHHQTVKTWNRHGLIAGHPFNDKNECLYQPTTQNPVRKQQGTKLAERAQAARFLANATDEVHHEA